MSEIDKDKERLTESAELSDSDRERIALTLNENLSVDELKAILKQGQAASKKADLVLDAWMADRLGSDEHRYLAGCVLENTDWRDRYQKRLQNYLPRLRVLPGDPALSLSDECVARLPLPHLGRNCRFVVRLASNGVDLWWGEGEKQSLSGQSSTVELGDDMIGRWTIPVEILPKDPAHEAGRVARAAIMAHEQAKTSAEVSPGTSQLAHAAVAGLAGLKAELERAATLFREGNDPDDATLDLIGSAVKARLALESSLAWFEDEQLLESVERVDDDLAPYEEAILLLEDATYDRLALEHDLPINAHAWWGLPERLRDIDVKSALEPKKRKPLNE